MKSVLIIADIAGQMEALSRLTALVPETTMKISLGDMIDRGPQSKDVLEYFMTGFGKDKLALLGNHEHFLLDRCKGLRMYDHSAWHYNGGGDTLQSFPNQTIPKEVVDWIDELPVSLEIEGPKDKLFVSHAPWFLDAMFLEEPSQYDIFNVVWNRDEPSYRPGYMQIFGHNSFWGLREFRTLTQPYALCIDQSSSKILTGYLYPEKEILQVPYSLEAEHEPESLPEDVGWED